MQLYILKAFISGKDQIMNNYIKDEINIKFFLPFVLYKWRIIIVTGLLCGFLLGSLRVIRGILLWEDQMENYQSCLELYNEEYETYEKTVNKYTKKINELQQWNHAGIDNMQQLMDVQNELDLLAEPVLEQVPPTIEHTIIRVFEFTIIGIVMGIVGAVYIYYCQYKRRGIIYSLEEFEIITDIYILGVFGKSNNNSKAEFDKNIINRINIHILNLKSDYKKILLMGQAEEVLIQKIAKELSQNLTEVHLLAECNKSDEEAECAENFNICDAIVLVEQRGKSTISEINKEIQLIESVNIPIIGAVII